MRSRSGTISPNTPTRSAVCGRSGDPNVLMQNGISEMWVMPCCATTSQKRLVDHLGISTAVAPAPSTEKKDQLWALTWKNGREMRGGSSGARAGFGAPKPLGPTPLGGGCAPAFGLVGVAAVNK